MIHSFTELTSQTRLIFRTSFSHLFYVKCTLWCALFIWLLVRFWASVKHPRSTVLYHQWRSNASLAQSRYVPWTQWQAVATLHHALCHSSSVRHQRASACCHIRWHPLHTGYSELPSLQSSPEYTDTVSRSVVTVRRDTFMFTTLSRTAQSISVSGMPTGAWHQLRYHIISSARVWNSLPVSIRESHSLPTFRRNLKTFYFQSAYPTSAAHLA